MNRLHPDLARVIISTDDIQARVRELAKQISHDYRNVERLYIIGILKGAFIFMADLCRELNIPHIVDFMAVSSYGKTTSTGAVRLLMDLREPIEGQHALIIEDIADSGHTLSYLYHVLKGRNPASLKTCVLLRKKRLGFNIPIDYLGFDIPDAWVVGYGLDYADTHRTLPFIAELKPEVYTK
ncbi:MAG: hypoxanthine phosphoribosyltransferase [Chloroflexi bacterium RBG_19FT_COMBO_47_9]|nr:MAG: hypoxanthine phosphoribosyltransferase [Chloroflexi bacterium RBG_19FT_COMBO_47_9]